LKLAVEIVAAAENPVAGAGADTTGPTGALDSPPAPAHGSTSEQDSDDSKSLAAGKNGDEGEGAMEGAVAGQGSTSEGDADSGDEEAFVMVATEDPTTAAETAGPTCMSDSPTASGCSSDGSSGTDPNGNGDEGETLVVMEGAATTAHAGKGSTPEGEADAPGGAGGAAGGEGPVAAPGNDGSSLIIDYDLNFILETEYQQEEVPEEFKGNPLPEVLNYCERRAQKRGAVGFFYQQHTNGHEIVGFYGSIEAMQGRRVWHDHVRGFLATPPPASTGVEGTAQEVLVPTPAPAPLAPAPAPTPIAPPWCVKGGSAIYTRTGEPCTIIEIHSLMPGDTTTFVTVAFEEGGSSTRETSVDKLSPGRLGTNVATHAVATSGAAAASVGQTGVEPAENTATETSTGASPSVGGPVAGVPASPQPPQSAVTKHTDAEDGGDTTTVAPPEVAPGKAALEEAFCRQFAAYRNEIIQLVAMGFSDLPANAKLLERHSGSIEAVVGSLLSGNGC